ncbi:LIM domain kinase 1 [Sarcoptes scabiei]|uniref:non-specific serine/threonine protein kinase n=1 Tax=Sarcoptes scabiei TaxID=52283 RepID=A0A834R2G7_SARSC|nr:LIM domain kinase 1 [Sarcoptes scabiei]
MKCSSCCEEINDDDQIVEAITSNRNKKFCHLKCFRCSICQQSLFDWDFEKDGILYCAADYHSKFGERCRYCQHFMTGPVMVIGGGDYKFHPECFKCDKCNSIIGDDESYGYIRCRQLLCSHCFQKQFNLTTSIDSTGNFNEKTLNNGPICYRKYSDNVSNHKDGLNDNKINHSNHSYNDHYQHQVNNHLIQTIEIAPVSNGHQRRIRLTLKDCRSGHLNSYCVNGNDKSNQSDLDNENHPMIVSEIDVHYDNHLFHIADTILKINGESLEKHRTLKDVKNLFDRHQNDVLHLLVEHNPNHQTRNFPKTLSSKSNAEDSQESNGGDRAKHYLYHQHEKQHHNHLDEKNHLNCNNNSNNIHQYSDNVHNSEIDVERREKADQNGDHLKTLDVIVNEYCCSAKNHENVDYLKDKIKNKRPVSTNQTDALPPTDPSSKKRYQRRERSSSLSRLLEAINLDKSSNGEDHLHHQSIGVKAAKSSHISLNNHQMNSLESKQSINDHAGRVSSVGNNFDRNQSFFTSPRNNGLYSRLNNCNTLSRTKSFRVEPKSYRIFRATDLVKGALLGKGFYGEVFEVTDKVTQEKMVMKELYHNDREAEANFVREVSILKSLNHKNVLHFIGILYRGKKLNLITEYITGGTLRQMIQDERHPIHWPERIGWAKDISSGVNYLHSMNLIHRDLNSQNCLVRNDGTVVVADFGLSKITTNCTDDVKDDNCITNTNYTIFDSIVCFSRYESSN